MAFIDSLVGRALGNYQIERLLGRGGMASVYFGLDLHLQRPAAIKVIDDRYRGDSEYAERFLREARAMAGWRHPNIPQIYQAGEEDGIYYYAMEYIQGMDLEQGLRRYTQRGELLPYEDVLLIARSVAEALDYAHQKGAIHRDVKPSNILISEDDRILLSDFGLVLQVDKGTKGEVFGSPQYIAPEQARNSAEAVPQSDVYALGVILYEMLVGRLPFEDPSPAALAIKHITEEPPAPRAINPQLSSEVEAVLLKALKKMPGERYATGRELVKALEKALPVQAGGTLAAPPATIPRATLPELPRDGKTQPPGTVSLLRLADLMTAVRANEPSTLPSLDPPIQPPPPPAPVPGSRPRTPDGRTRSRSTKLLGLGCAGLGLAAVIILAFGAILLSNMQKDPAALPLQTLSGAPTLVGTPSIPGTTTPRFLSTFTPTATATKQRSTATATATKRPSTATPIVFPTRELVFLFTPSVSPSPNPRSTPVEVREYHLLFVPQKDDSFFVINKGVEDLPLASLSLGEGEHQLKGEEWKEELLQSGECAAVWKDGGNPKPPRNADCKVVGEHLIRSGPDKFWTTSYKVYFLDVYLKTCKSGQPCDLQFRTEEYGG